MIDSFDNIACDGLLICESYMGKYSLADKPYVRDFIFWSYPSSDKIHRLIWGNILTSWFVCVIKESGADWHLQSKQLYWFARKINEFLNKEMSKYMADTEVKKDIENLNIEIANGIMSMNLGVKLMTISWTEPGWSKHTSRVDTEL